MSIQQLCDLHRHKYQQVVLQTSCQQLDTQKPAGSPYAHLDILSRTQHTLTHTHTHTYTHPRKDRGNFFSLSDSCWTAWTWAFMRVWSDLHVFTFFNQQCCCCIRMWFFNIQHSMLQIVLILLDCRYLLISDDHLLCHKMLARLSAQMLCCVYQ